MGSGRPLEKIFSRREIEKKPKCYVRVRPVEMVNIGERSLQPCKGLGEINVHEAGLLAPGLVRHYHLTGPVVVPESCPPIPNSAPVVRCCGVHSSQPELESQISIFFFMFAFYCF